MSILAPAPTATVGVLRRIPLWMWSAIVLIVVLTVALLVSIGRAPEWLVPFTGGAKLGLEAVSLLWAASRRDLPARFRLALQILGATSSISAVLSFIASIYFAQGNMRLPAIYDGSWVLASYGLATLALFLIPRTPPRRGANLTLSLDLLILSTGVGTLNWTLLRLPFDGAAPQPFSMFVVVNYAVSTIGILAGVTVAVLRGRIVPSRRAFAWFMVGQAIYVPIALLSSVTWSNTFAEPLLDAAYQLGVIPTAIAAVLIRTDPYAQADAVPPAHWRRDFNPIVLLVPLMLGAFLLGSVRNGPGPQAQPLAVALTVVTVLLGARLALTSRETARLLAAEASEERRRQAEVSAAVSRLAGGIAHEFNNLMTTVIGNAEFGERAQRTGAAARDEFAQIRMAGERAATLTRQMLQYSGRQLTQMATHDLALVVAGPLEALRRSAGAPITVEAIRGLMVRCDPAQVVQLVAELVANARRATPDPGDIRVTLDRVTLDAPLDSRFLSVGSGAFARLVVADSGSGIDRDILPKIFDPFFSTQPMHAAPGLGLAAVYGIVAAHLGGITVQSSSGRGTTVSVYLPLADSARDVTATRPE